MSTLQEIVTYLGRYFVILKSSAFCLPPSSSGLQLLEMAQK